MKPKQFFFILIGICGVIIVGGGVGYYYALNAFHSKTAELKTKLADQQVADDRINRLNQLKRQYAQIEPLISKLDEALPKNKQQSELVLQLDELAKRAGLTLPGATFTPSTAPTGTSQTAKEGDVLALPITMQIKGSYPQIQTFLRSLEKLNRYVSVNTISITSQGSTVGFDISLKAFLKP